MQKSFVLSILFILFLALASAAQTMSCVKGDFFTDYRKPSDELKAQLEAAEKKLCAEIKEDSALQAIYGFVRGAIVRVYKNKAVFTVYENSARYKERELSETELKNLQKELAAADLETISPVGNVCIDRCSKYEFVSITRQSGRRVFIYSSERPTPMDGIENFYAALEKSGKFRIRYYLQDQFKEMKLLFADDRFWIESFWKNGDDMRVLVIDNDAKDWDKRFSWRKFSNGVLGENVAQPEDSQYLNPDGIARFCNDYPFIIGLGQYSLCPDDDGLWKVRKGERIKIQDGIINYPFVTPDKKWVIYGKANEEWRNLYYLYRFNLATKEEFKLNLPAADFVGAAYYLVSQNKVLVTRYRIESRRRENNPSPEKPLFYLLDLETGEVALTTGEVAPLMQIVYRDLQPTKNPNEFWATIPDWKNYSQTLIGRYNTKTLTFTPLIKLSEIVFNSNDMWVDEQDRRIYFIYDRHLLSMPLPKEK